jgi:hypothetical protein
MLAEDTACVRCDGQTDGRNAFIKGFQLSRGFTWSSAIPLRISSAVDEHRLCPTLRSHLGTFSNRGYERIGVVRTLYQAHKFFSVWLSSVRFCVPEETNQQRSGMEGATDSSIGQYGALSWRSDKPEGAWPQSQWTTSCVCRSWVRSSRTQINAGNTKQPCRRNDDQGKWEPYLRAETCIKRSTSSYTVWVRIQRKVLYEALK